MAVIAVLAAAAASGGAAVQPAAAQGEPEAHFLVNSPRGDLTKAHASIAAAGGTVVQSWPQIGVTVVRSPSADFARSVRRRPGVQSAGASRGLAELPAPAPFAERLLGRDDDVERIVGVTTSDDAAAAAVAQEPLEANQWGLRMIRADAAHEVSQGSRNVLVGVLDSGVEATHLDLAPNLDASNSVGCTAEGVPDTSPAAWSPTTSSHGTHVAGTIAAARNGIGVAGVAPNVRIASVKVVDDDGFIYPEYAICGFVWAAEHGMDATNSSYFVDPWVKWCATDLDQRAAAESVGRAITFARKAGSVNVSSTGNENWDLSQPVVDQTSPNHQQPVTRRLTGACRKLPVEVAGVIGVSAVGPTALKSYYSSYGIGDTEVTAPGGDSRVPADTPDGNGRILSTVVGGAWGYSQGTSMASPHATGVVALIRSTHPTWTVTRVEKELGRQADRLPCPPNPYDPTGDGAYRATCYGGATGRGFYGAGLVDALDAVTK
jgi:subtilisin family serine protease